MPNTRKQKVSSIAGSDSRGVSRTKPPAADADISDMANIISPSAKKAAKAENNAAAVIIIKDRESKPGSSDNTSSPPKSPIKRTQGK